MYTKLIDVTLDNKSKFSTKKFIPIFCLTYLPLKILFVFTLIIFLPFAFNKNYFEYPDFVSNYTTCDITSPNLFFNYFVCYIGIEDIDNFLSIFLAFVINTLKDFGFIIIAIKFLSKRYVVFFLFLIIIHPYLNLYQARFTTDVIASLAVYILFYIIIYNKGNKFIWDFILVIFTGFRNSFLIILFYYYFHKIFQKLYNNHKILEKIRYIFFILFLFIILFLITQNDLIIRLFFEQYSASRNFNVLNYFISTNIYNLNINYFYEIINSPSIIINYILAILLLSFTNLILLTGFREAAFTTFPDYFFQNDIVTTISILVGAILFIVHTLGLYFFIRYYVKLNKINLCFIFFILFHIFTISHLRYFYPIIPISLLGLITYFENKKILKN
tara:strand:+ start:2510 stop:3670 length:1161 start_codon:yes stop_codon:yes gene_type:complete